MKVIIILLLVLLSPFSHAAILKTGMGVEILAVDGKKIATSFFSDVDIDLSDGIHQVVVRYSNNFKGSEQVESKPYIFNVNVKGDTEVGTARFHHQKQAESAIRHGLVWIITNNEQTEKIASFDILTGKGVMPYNDIEKVVADYNKAHEIPSLGITSALDSASQVATAVNETTAPAGKAALTKAAQLKLLYKAANKPERKAFRLWLLDQELK